VEWIKAPENLIERFNDVLPDHPEIERRKMFGYPCAFVNGNLFSGLHAATMFVRLPDAERNTLLQIDGAHLLEPMPGRAMREYVVLPDAILGDDESLTQWLETSFTCALALPPKVKKPRSKKAS
jgi:TfoX/Sxy family transcriptional regulator of competence genes